MSRMIVCLGCLAIASLAVPAPSRADGSETTKVRAYVGTYTGGKSRGIYLLEMDPASGALTSRGVVAETPNPSFLAIHPSRKFLYAVSEIDQFGGKKTGAVAAFAIDSATGNLTALNRVSSRGAGPCYLVVDKAGKHVLVANYGGGSVAVLPIEEGGRLGEATSAIQHTGSGHDPSRQEGPHAHSINLDAANRFAVAADLGLDEVLVYRFDAGKGTLTPNEPPFAKVAPGAGPRHFAFHPDGRHAFVINEMHSTVTAFQYDPERGILEPKETISTLPLGKYPGNSTAEVQVHPSGKFLYGSNRGHNSIAIFTIEPQTAKLSAVGYQLTQGKTPRNFGIDPSGTYLLAANQDSDSIVAFKIDPRTGQLKPTGQTIEVPKPVCVKMIAVDGR